MSARSTRLASGHLIRNAANSNPSPARVGQAAHLSYCHTPETHVRLGGTLTQIPIATRSGFLTPSQHQTAPHRNRASPAAVDTTSHIPNYSLQAHDYQGPP